MAYAKRGSTYIINGEKYKLAKVARRSQRAGVGMTISASRRQVRLNGYPSLPHQPEPRNRHRAKQFGRETMIIT